MAFIQSSATVSATAYLTELGRQYLFNNSSKPRYFTRGDGTTVDRFLVHSFSLGDPDVNYDIAILLSSGTIPDVSGENESSLKATKGRELHNLIDPDEANFEESVETLEYQPSSEVSIDFSRDLNDIDTVFTVQLMTFINGENVLDGQYSVTPTNYGPNKSVNDELFIPLRDATESQKGYRLRIFFPTTGEDYNKMTFQLEEGKFQRGRIVTSVTQEFVPEDGSTGGGTVNINTET